MILTFYLLFYIYYTSKFQSISLLLQSQSKELMVTSLGAGREQVVLDAVVLAAKEGNWLLVENLHLASDTFCRDLRYLLQSLAHNPKPAGE